MNEILKLESHLNQRIPIYSIEIPSTINQDDFLKILNPIIPRNPYYIKTIITKFIKSCESANIEVEDAVYETLMELLSSKELAPTDNDIIRYFVGGFGNRVYDKTIDIQETPKLISGSGTTGFRTWAAALYLSNYLVNNAVLNNKRVLELGTGTGLVGLTLCKYHHGIKQVILTDGDSSLIERLNHSFKLNEIKRGDLITTQKLWWGEDDLIPENDIIIAADVTYDSTIVSSLAETIQRSFLTTNCCEALIAATIRNTVTISKWETTLDEFRLKWEVIDRCERPEDAYALCWFQKGAPEIRIYRILKYDWY